ncbi:MAG: cell division protein FtsA [Alphaproteobacteria bacterium]|nr:cell division protein FtsA [Alphaproteobacteria bacterium]
MTHTFGKTATIAALDIGSSKVSCIIARVSKDKKISIIGYGYNASKGIKNGAVTDIAQATLAVGNAVQDAEQMANETIDKVVISIGGEKVRSVMKSASMALNKNRPIGDAELEKLYLKGTAKVDVGEYSLIHCIHNSYNLDKGEMIKDPRNLFGEELSINILLGLVPEHICRNLNTITENAHLDISGRVFDSYASGLACLVEDEKEMGATVVDMGGGSTSIATFRNGYPVHFTSIPVGGSNVTNDIAYGLSTSFSHAERLKTLHGCAFLTSQDSLDTINVYPVGEEDDSCIKHIPKSELINIIAPRIEETFEMVAKKLSDVGLGGDSSHRVVLTGGASQLAGVVNVAEMVLDKHVRLGKPKNVANLPDALNSPAFATAVGMLLFGVECSERRPKKIVRKINNANGGLWDNVSVWLKTLWG